MNISVENCEKSYLDRVLEEQHKNGLSEDAIVDWYNKTFSESHRKRMRYDWFLNARPKQLLPITTPNWKRMFIRAGRGFGKTRCGAETVIHEARKGTTRDIAIVGETFEETQTVMMEGPGGIMTHSPPDFYPNYLPTKHTVTWPNGVVGHTYTGDKPRGLRGPGFGFAWIDEIAKMIYGREIFNQIIFCNREKGTDGKILFTGTPEPKKIVIDLCKNKKTIVVTGGTHENYRNLSDSYIQDLVDEFGGTRFFDQEFYGVLFEDNPQAQWKKTWLDANRVTKAPPLIYIVVFVDPNVSNTERSDENGIIVVGLGSNGHHYILADCTMRGTPNERANAAAAAYYMYNANKLVYEPNQGGDLVGQSLALACPEADIIDQRAFKGKVIRAGPISILHERGDAHMVGNNFERLEEQLCDWVPGEPSPDRLDAMVGAEIHLISVAGQPSGEPFDITEGIQAPNFLSPFSP